MKSFNEWLNKRDEEFNQNEGWWPFGRKDLGSEPEVVTSMDMSSKEPHWSEDPRNEAGPGLKGRDAFNAVGFVDCPHCRSPLHRWDFKGSDYGRCPKCHKLVWVSKELARDMARSAAHADAKSRGAHDYNFDGGRYKTDPKGAARAEERAKYAIRADLSNI